jgi:transcriptional regulator with XRE-family HTH domain
VKKNTIKSAQTKSVKSIYLPEYEKIVSKLKNTRKELGLKQDIVAEKIGKYQSYVSKIENGERRLDIIELIQLAKLYNKSVDYFIAVEKKKGKTEKQTK